MPQQIVLAKMPLNADETYEEFDNYFSMVIPDNNKSYHQCVFKEPTSIMNPIVKLQANFVEVSMYNYCRIDWAEDDEQTFKRRYYYIDDVVTIGNNIVELHLSFDAFRSVNWLNSGTTLQLRYSTNNAHWCQTAEENRFEPYTSYGNSGSKGWRLETNLPAAADAEATENVGVYLVKFWCGYNNNTTHEKLGIMYAMMGQTSFNYFIYQVNHFIEQNYGSQLYGITDFTKFILSIKYYPSLYLKGTGHDTAPRMAGYGVAHEIGVGGLCFIDTSGYADFTVYLRDQNAGFLDSYFNRNVDEDDQYFEIYPLGQNSYYTNELARMKFLTTPRWCQYVVKTPVGIGSIDCSTIRQGEKIFYESQIDLESGIMTMNFYRGKGAHQDALYGRDTDLLLSLSGPVAYDVSDQATHIQSNEEVAMNTLAKANVKGFFDGIGHLGDPKKLFGSTVETFASFPQQFVNDQMMPREINQPKAQNGSNKYYMHTCNDALKYFYVRTTIYTNPDTPIYDNHTYSASETDWNGSYIYENYFAWCRELYHGFPSFKVINCDPNTLLAAGNLWMQCAAIFDIHSSNYIKMTPDIENQIKAILMNGVVIHPGPIVT